LPASLVIPEDLFKLLPFLLVFTVIDSIGIKKNDVPSVHQCDPIQVEGSHLTLAKRSLGISKSQMSDGRFEVYEPRTGQKTRRAIDWPQSIFKAPSITLPLHT
jgi:hypothetical protein